MKKIVSTRTIGFVAGAAVIATLSGISGATAGSLITSRQIKDATITSVDVRDKGLRLADLDDTARRAINKSGPAGPQGPQGPMGPMGPEGPQGLAGAIGPAGAKGAAGPQGDTGPAGAVGERGPAGATGPKGDTGAPGATGPQGATGAQGPAGISHVTTLTLPAGTRITPDGTVLGQLTLSSQSNYVVTAGVTALASSNDSLQCQLSSSLSPNWDDMGEANLTARATVPLEHAYPRRSLLTSYTVYVACRSLAADYIVDTGHLYAWQVGSIAAPGSHVIYSSPKGSLSWEPMG